MENAMHGQRMVARAGPAGHQGGRIPLPKGGRMPSPYGLAALGCRMSSGALTSTFGLSATGISAATCERLGSASIIACMARRASAAARAAAERRACNASCVGSGCETLAVWLPSGLPAGTLRADCAVAALVKSSPARRRAILVIELQRMRMLIVDSSAICPVGACQ